MFSAALKHVMTGQAAIPGDPLLASNVLLLKTIGTNNATNASFVDSSSNNFTVTRTGDVTQGAFSPYVPTGYWSNYFDGSGDILTAPSNAAFTFGTGDFCMEAWYFSGTTTRMDIVGRYNGDNAGSWGLALNINSTRDVCWYNGNTVRISSSANAWELNVWNHFAVTRSGTTLRLFINGVQVSSVTHTVDLTDNGQLLYISGGGGAGGILNGFISNLRIVKGSAVYTSNFTPPTTPLTAISGTSLLTCQDNRFIDRSSNNFTLTRTGDVSVRRFAPFGLSWDSSLGGSAYFDGSDDYLALPSSSGQLGAGNFTVEMWAFPVTKTVSFPCLFSNYSSWSTGGSFGIFADHNSSTGWTLAVNGTFPLINGGAVIYNQWTHLAVTRVGSTMTLYVNGVASGTATMSATLNGNGTSTYIGTAGDIIPQSFNGFISDVRIVRSAVYTANFTPPTSPVTAITNTSLLLNFNNAAVYDATRSSNFTLNGTTQTSTAQKNYADTSVSLSTAAGNRGLQTVDRPELRFGTGDFTAELWWRPSVLSGYQTIINKGYGSTGGLALQSNANRIEVYVNGSTFTAPANRVVTNNAWNHIALVRSAGTVTLWVNGLSAGSVANSANLSITDDLLIGWETQGGNAYPASGNVEDVRFSRTARYTAAFTPPARALPVTAG